MTTLTTAIQTLVDNLQTKMTSNAPLTPEEQTLVATAIEKLSSQVNIEQALVAVAVEHLGDAKTALSESLGAAKTAMNEELEETGEAVTGALAEAKTALTEALTSAETSLTTEVKEATDTLSSAETAINTAKTKMEQESERITDIGEALQGNMESFTAENIALSQRSIVRSVFPLLNNIETVSTDSDYRRSQAIFAIYDAGGETFAVRPSFNRTTFGREYSILEYIKMSKDGMAYHHLSRHRLHSVFDATLASYLYYHGSVAVLPLASKSDPSNISYEEIYSTQSFGNESSNYYQGVYCRKAGYSSATKPVKNLDATDQWGVTTDTSYSWQRAGVLYNNKKNCLVVVDYSSRRIIEKYSDGNITTETTISSVSQLQNYVNSGDFTVVRFIGVSIEWTRCNSVISSNNTNTSNSEHSDCWGYFGILNNSLRMGGSSYSAHYRFTKDKKLEPLNYFFASSVNYPSANDGAMGDVRVALATTKGETMCVYHYQLKSNYKGYPTGYLANSIMCMNPYSHTGIINEHQNYHGSTRYYGIGRTCKAF